MPRRYRVWTKNASSQNPLTCWTDWMTYAQCKKWIIGRWGHWPPFAYISQAQDSVSFTNANGE